MRRTGRSAENEIPRLSSDEGAAWGGFLRAHYRIVARLDADLRQHHGLSLSEYEVMLLLAWAEGHERPMSDLVRLVLMTPSGLTRTVDRLESQGLVVRRASPRDGRATLAALTQAGLVRFAPANMAHQAGIRRYFLAHAGSKLQKELGAFWTRVNAAARLEEDV